MVPCIGSTVASSNTSQRWVSAVPNATIFAGVEESSGWRPQNVPLNALKVVDLNQAIKDPNTPFKTCSPYIEKFVSVGNQVGIPPILLASFAMQEVCTVMVCVRMEFLLIRHP